MRFRFNRRNGPEEEPGMVPTRFRQYVNRRSRRLNEVSPQGKVVAALNKCLAMQGAEDKNNYYVAGNKMYCPTIQSTEAVRDGKKVGSYSASGRCQVGRLIDDKLSFTVMSFKLRFRDSEDEMGLPDLVIEEASMDDLGRNAPMRG